MVNLHGQRSAHNQQWKVLHSRDARTDGHECNTAASRSRILSESLNIEGRERDFLQENSFPR